MWDISPKDDETKEIQEHSYNYIGEDINSSDGWSIDWRTTNLTQLTSGSVGWETCPDWSPDGSKIAYDGWIMNADGSNRIKIDGVQPSWSPDGSQIAYFNTIDDIWIADANGSNAINLRGLQYGTLSITSTPSGANIYLDGVAAGFETPHTFTNIPSGLHTIKLTLHGYQDWYGTATVTAGLTTDIYATLIPCIQVEIPPVYGKPGQIIEVLVKTPDDLTGKNEGEPSVNPIDGIFTVAPLITSITHDAAKTLGYGNVFTVTMQGVSGGTATFAISNLATTTMTEVSSGTY